MLPGNEGCGGCRAATVAALKALVERIIDRWNNRNVLPRTEGASGRDSIVILIGAIGEQVERDPTDVRVLYALMFEALRPIPELKSTFVEFHATARWSSPAARRAARTPPGRARSAGGGASSGRWRCCSSPLSLPHRVKRVLSGGVRSGAE
jgi:hypothetical protein